MSVNLPQLEQSFRDAFGRPAALMAWAPGRVNLIGEHTDYNDGFVLPIAIERQTVALATPRDDGLLRMRSAQADEPVEADLTGELAPGPAAWANYPLGVAAMLARRGVALRGAEIYFDSSVPLGGGLSSSASLEVAAAKALLAVAETPDAVTGRSLAEACQQAEHEFAGAPCGIMDQSIAILGQADRALLLDCRSGETRQIPFDRPDVVLLVVNTEVKHAIADGGYAARRDQCYAAAGTLKVSALRDTTPEVVDAAGAEGLLSGAELKRARHVTGEIARAQSGAEALERGDYTTFGELMYESHASLRNDYEVSCDELDAVVDQARPLEGVYGARMTGGGFGGCAIVLVAADRADQAAQAVSQGFAQRFGRACPIFATRAAAGAHWRPL